MAKKVFELAKELDIGSVQLVEQLRDMGYSVRNHMVSLSDEDVTKILSSFEKKNEDAKAAKASKKKKVVKKKKTVKKKTTAAKAEASTGAETEEGVKAAEGEKPKAKKTKKVITVKKKKVVKKKADKKAAFEEKKAREEAAIQEQKAEERGEGEGASVYKEKMHTFTPVFVPEEKASDRSDEDQEDFEEPTEDGDSDDKKGSSKKRLGDLAAIVTKKGVGEKSKDLSILRAEEEMKLATSVVGNAVYVPARRKKIYTGETKETKITEVKDSKRVVRIHDYVVAKDLSQQLSQKFKSFANKCLELNLLVDEDDYIGEQLASEIAELYNYRVENIAFDEKELIEDVQAKVDKSDLPLRNPIITVMGHVDHGKTTLLDYIRKEKVAAGEAGGITQHIGAYSVKVKGSTLTFLDTPGHAAFASMRQRGADVTDIVILVVAADDGVMPQTKESIRFIQNSKKPVIVAVNKMDKEGANPDRIKQDLMEFSITPEEWGGDTQFVEISALKGDGIDNLLESVQLQAEIMDLRETPKGAAEGVIIESKVETGRGPVCTVLIQKGTLNKGDSIVVGEHFGRARSLMDHTGNMLKSAGPSMPVQILGLSSVPNPGDILNVVKNEREAKKIVEAREEERKAIAQASKKKLSLEDFFATETAEGEKKVLKLVIRADVQGSFEAIQNSLESLGNDEVGVEVIGGGVGAITDNDVHLASSVAGYIIGFNMRPVTSARRLAEEKGVDVKTYSIIYELIDEIKLALEGMLEPEKVEKYIGRAQVKDTFNIPKIGVIAGSSVIDGKIERGCNIRLLRDGKIIFDGKLSSLKRFKDDVKEVKNGYECGVALEDYNDIKVDDIFEAYTFEEKKRTLGAVSEGALR
ncbi:MAG: translation initiation factor IF-2 [Halobacteriovoraceae bacterium]|nr:translation initiation factor IF-2 [Halobacteriovoraceae bacterium]MCB9095708.1 translation initiation factor IF-2 [Halobacteriovoraceae bacterium]